jgi:hypothetical protein
MELYDRVMLITDKYKEEEVLKGDIGDIIEIYYGKGIPIGYEVAFTNPDTGEDYARFAVQSDEIIVIE